MQPAETIRHRWVRWFEFRQWRRPCVQWSAFPPLRFWLPTRRFHIRQRIPRTEASRAPPGSSFEAWAQEEKGKPEGPATIPGLKWSTAYRFPHPRPDERTSAVAEARW